MKSSPAIPNAERSAALFGCTVDQAKRQFSRNAASLKIMADRAAKSGKKVNGYTEKELRESAERYSRAAQ